MSIRQLKILTSITNRDSESLDKYFQEVNKFKLISPEEEVELATLIKKGDQTSLHSLIKANLRFVVSVAKQYQHQGLSLSDLINEGNIGLMKAAGSFDPTRGFKFISYAVWWIRQHIMLAIAENARIVRLPMKKVALKKNIYKANSLLEQKFERPATEEELASELNIPLEEITESLNMNEYHLSLDSPLSEEGDENMIDVFKNPNAADTDEELVNAGSLKMELARSFKMLTPQQKETICYFFGIGISHPMSLDEIAKKFSLSRERVRQIKDKAILILKNTRSIQLLRSYV